MKPKNLVIFGIYVVVFIILVTYITFPNPNLTLVTRTTFEKTVDVDQKKLFDLMADVEKYPTVLTDNVVSVHVINNTKNVIFAKEIVQESGIRTELTVKHIIIPYKQHIVEVIGGDANGTRIIVNFDEVNSQTKIETTVEMHLRGLLMPFAYLPQDNIQHAMNTVLDHFVSYLKNSEN
jgi:ribosome-associated toxin RatA of RatAB toxin-antitoxin module